MVAPSEFEQILKTVDQWPPEYRMRLAKALIVQSATPRPPKKITIKDFLGVARGDGPPPTDEEVEKIVERARWQKYGR